jgi:glycosyltransferase involved in cell wall biosynthesis
MDQIQGLVSVLIPTYNRAQLCKKAVESVLSQTYHDIEVIVVDDGSSDDTREVVSSLDARVRYLYQKNSGVSAARNLGMQSARGEFLAFLDSDDAWLPWKLELQLNALRLFPSAGMVWTDMIAVDETGSELYTSYLALMYGAYKHFDPAIHFRVAESIEAIWDNCPAAWVGRKCYLGNIFTRMFFGNLVHTSTVLLRRSMQESVGYFDISLVRSGEDYDFHFRTSRIGDVAYIDVSSIRYRIGASDQLTSSDLSIWIARNDLKTITKMVSCARDEIPLPDSSIRKRFAHSYAWMASEELFQDTNSARRHFLESLRLNPFQMSVAAYCLLSFLPTRLLRILRDVKRRLVRLIIGGKPPRLLEDTRAREASSARIHAGKPDNR